jgi:prepilin-type N-terminal cleavage/methylation domain-containing protein
VELIQAVLKNNMLNKKGVTLVEVMIALVVLLIVFMGLLQAAVLTIESNTTNLMRDEMTRVTTGIASEAKNNIAFDDLKDDVAGDMTRNLPACTVPPVSDAGNYVPIDLPVRNMTIQCGSRREVIDRLDPITGVADTKQVKILVRCEFKNECYSQSFATTRRR